MQHPADTPFIPVLEVQQLHLDLQVGKKRFSAVQDLSFHIAPGEVFGLVGESGCGKSLTALAITGLLPGAIRQTQGHILYQGVVLDSLRRAQRRAYLGKHIATIFQDPMTSLNPLMTIGQQIAEMYQIHEQSRPSEAMERAIEQLRSVHVPSPELRAFEYPHQLSGGMRQRVMIAMALACSPQLIIADEPTTALDASLQTEVMQLLLEHCRQSGTAVLMISHDMGVIAQVCQRVAVMYAGQLVEMQTVDQLFARPLHPYTQGLLSAIPRRGQRLAQGQLPLTEIKGMVPSLAERGQGCHFADRCSQALDICRTAAVPLQETSDYSIRCQLYAPRS